MHQLYVNHVRHTYPVHFVQCFGTQIFRPWLYCAIYIYLLDMKIDGMSLLSQCWIIITIGKLKIVKTLCVLGVYYQRHAFDYFCLVVGDPFARPSCIIANYGFIKWSHVFMWLPMNKYEYTLQISPYCSKQKCKMLSQSRLFPIQFQESDCTIYCHACCIFIPHFRRSCWIMIIYPNHAIIHKFCSYFVLSFNTTW